MHTAIKIPLQSLSPLVVRDLQEKYPSAIVRIESAAAVTFSSMDEAAFWRIISLLDWGRKRSEGIIAPAVEALSLFSETSIAQFDQLLAEKLHALDGEKFALPLGWDNKDGQHFSVDGFLYARCCAIANGKEFYEQVLNNPSKMPKEHSFEALLYIAEKAHRLKTASERYDFLPTVSYETFSNHEGWPRMSPLSDLIKGKSA
ncbi:MAG: DUF4240 domain-containing protein [Saprospiraceae bacterium]|jgi:hypothetical protein|nr:DUF4240 domain-containing protein [Saprospiraceae bacterium]